MKVLVIGGTGTVGSQIVEGLQAVGAEVGIHTRDASKAKAANAKATIHTGDLVEPATVRSIFKGYEAVYLLQHTVPTETHEGLMCIDGAMLNGVKRFVYLSVHRLDDAPHLPHFGAKIGIEEAVKKSGMEWTIIRPNNFYQNDYWFKDALLQYNVYPQPLGSKGLHRVDVRDIAEVSVISLMQSGHSGQVYDLVGPDATTGPGAAQLWSKALGKPINYGSEDMDAWEKMNSQWFPAFLAFDWRLMYEFFQKEGLLATPQSIERLTKLLGHAPRSYGAFVNETAKMWLK